MNHNQEMFETGNLVAWAEQHWAGIQEMVKYFGPGPFRVKEVFTRKAYCDCALQKCEGMVPDYLVPTSWSEIEQHNNNCPLHKLPPVVNGPLHLGGSHEQILVVENLDGERVGLNGKLAFSGWWFRKISQ